jgi:hypothetical protein
MVKRPGQGKARARAVCVATTSKVAEQQHSLCLTNVPAVEYVRMKVDRRNIKYTSL